MWLAELHTAPERSVLAAPLTIASAIAARTQRMKVGIAVQVLPLCHPLRLAEEACTVDHISHGRLIMGVGRSGFPRVYQAYGISYAESRERFAEVLEILKRVLDAGALLVPRQVSTISTTFTWCRNRTPSPIRNCASRRPAPTPIRRSARRATRSSSPPAWAI